MNHPSTAVGSSGKVWCTQCMLNAPTLDELNALQCRAEYMED